MAENLKNDSINRHSDVVLSTRVRLARNIDGIPFPVRLNSLEKQEIGRKICRILSLESCCPDIIEMNSLYPFQAIALAEKHLISPEFTSGDDGRILLLDRDEKVSIMLCEKDHIRIQGFEQGLDTDGAYKRALFFDEILNSHLKLAFDMKLGYLNQNPKELGTGMRASVLMHLPALSNTGAMEKFSATAKKLGFSVRGSYGDGASVKGDIYRITNTVTMGISEEEALDNLKSIALQIATKERAAAERLISDMNIKDRINRSIGVIKNAVLMSSDEMMELLSWVRFGALYGLVDADTALLGKLFESLQPANLCVLANAKLTGRQMDEIRAATVKKVFEN